MFSIVEGVVDSKTILAKSSAQAVMPSSSLTAYQLPFTRAAKITRIAINSNSGPMQFIVNIFSASTKTFASRVIELSSEGSQEIDMADLSLAVTSTELKLFIEVLHTFGSNVTFDIVVYAEVMK